MERRKHEQFPSSDSESGKESPVDESRRAFIKKFGLGLAAVASGVVTPSLDLEKNNAQPSKQHDTLAEPTEEDLRAAQETGEAQHAKEFEEQQERLSEDVLLPKMDNYVSESLFLKENPHYFEDLVEQGEYSDAALLARMMLSEDDQVSVAVAPFIGHSALNRVKQSKNNKMPWNLQQVVLGYNNEGEFGEQKPDVPFSSVRGVLEGSKKSLQHLEQVNDIGHKIQDIQDQLRKDRSLQSLVIADMLLQGKLDDYNFGQNVFMHPVAQEALRDGGSTVHDAPDKQEEQWIKHLQAIKLELPIPKEIPKDHIRFYAITHPRDPFAYTPEDVSELAAA